MINPLEELCFQLSRRARVAHTAAPTTADYVRQRHSGLERQFTRHFERSRLVRVARRSPSSWARWRPIPLPDATADVVLCFDVSG